MKVKVKGKIKTAYETDSGYDVFVNKIEKIWRKNNKELHPDNELEELEFNLNIDSINLLPNERALINTGVRIELPEPINVKNEYYEVVEAQVRPKSGISNSGLIVAFGTVDNEYRGDIKVMVYNASNKSIALNKDNKIAQVVFGVIRKYNIEQVEEIDTNTDRGENGFGSTGLK